MLCNVTEVMGPELPDPQGFGFIFAQLMLCVSWQAAV